MFKMSSPTLFALLARITVWLSVGVLQAQNTTWSGSPWDNTTERSTVTMRRSSLVTGSVHARVSTTIESTHSATIILIVIMAILFGLIGLLTYIYFCQKYHVFNDSTTNKSPGLIKESWNPNWRQNKVSLTKKKHKAADYLPASLNRTTTKWSSLKTGKESKQSNETKQNQTDSAAASNAFTGKDSKQKSSKKKRTWRRITSRKASSRRKDSSRKGSKGVATKRSSAKRVDAFTTKAVKLMLKKDKANSKLKKSKGHGSQFKKLKTKLLKNSSRQRTKTERG